MTAIATPADRLYAIVEQGLCIGCGLCQAVAGKRVISVTKVDSGYERPVVVGELDHSTVDDIYDVCPGTRIEGLPERLIEPDTRVDNVWGPWRRIARAWAADPGIRFEGATGGVLTALADYLVTSKRVAFVLHTRSSRTEPTFGERHLSFSSADVLSAAGSVYGPTAPLIDIADVLARNEPFAFIGKPCDIAALRNLARHDGRIDRLVRYWLTPVCGGFGEPQFTDSFIEALGIRRKDVTRFRYRGRGCPGPTRIETQDTAIERHYLDYWGDDESQWSLPFRCKICPDGIGEAADIAASDTWIGGSPNRTDSETDPGTNAVIARTKAGEELIAAAVRDGALTIEYDITPDEMSVYQPHQMRKKYAAWPRHQGLADEGRIVPVTHRLRIRELAEELPPSHSTYQREGTRKRVRAGKGTEASPSNSSLLRAQG